MFSLLSLDPKSTFYRICPGCGKAHMVKNRGRDYCSDKCYQDYYNQFKRKIRSLKLDEDVENKIPENQKYQPPIRNENPKLLNQNIQILEKILSGESEKDVDLFELEAKGFNFFAFSFHYPIDETRNNSCMEFGPFETYWLGQSKFRIRTKIKN
jgi:hypothetical protein